MKKEDFQTWIKNSMESCRICPRMCEAFRLTGKSGYCKMTDEILISRVSLHMWEEPCISGTSGSGTVFFAGCNMGCVYCQNYKISRNISGREELYKKITPEKLAEVYIKLQQKGAANINLVTPTHYIPQVAYSIFLAKEAGLVIPVVYNTGGYERVDSIKKLEGLVDIYLPDYKYNDTKRAARYSKAPDYPAVVREALAEMYRQVGSVKFDSETGLLKKGMIVRHLVLPDTNSDTKQILRYLKEQYGEEIYVSLMHQYTPIAEELSDFPELRETVSDEQYDRCVSFAEKIGMENVYIQDSLAATDVFIPDFGSFDIDMKDL